MNNNFGKFKLCEYFCSIILLFHEYNLNTMNKDKTNRLETTKDKIKSIAVTITATEFNRSSDWVYKVLKGKIENKNTQGVKEFFENEYKIIASKI